MTQKNKNQIDSYDRQYVFYIPHQFRTFGIQDKSQFHFRIILNKFCTFQLFLSL